MILSPTKALKIRRKLVYESDEAYEPLPKMGTSDAATQTDEGKSRIWFLELNMCGASRAIFKIHTWKVPNLETYFMIVSFLLQILAYFT